MDWSGEYFLRKEYSQLIQYDVKLKRDSADINFSSLSPSSKIFIDNKLIDNIKNNSKLLKSGIHNLIVDIENEKSRLGMDFNIKPDKNYKVVLKKNKFFIRPFLYSVILPGIGQFSDGARAKGALIFVSTFTLATATILSSVNYSKKINNYNAERINYLNAMNEYDALADRDNMNILKNDADKALTWKRIFTGLFLGAYIYNIIDVLFYHSFKDVLVLEQFNLGIVKDNSENIGEVYLHTEFHF